MKFTCECTFDKSTHPNESIRQQENNSTAHAILQKIAANLLKGIRDRKLNEHTIDGIPSLRGRFRLQHYETPEEELNWVSDSENKALLRQGNP